MPWRSTNHTLTTCTMIVPQIPKAFYTNHTCTTIEHKSKLATCCNSHSRGTSLRCSASRPRPLVGPWGPGGRTRGARGSAGSGRRCRPPARCSRFGAPSPGSSGGGSTSGMRKKELCIAGLGWICDCERRKRRVWKSFNFSFSHFWLSLILESRGECKRG